MARAYKRLITQEERDGLKAATRKTYVAAGNNQTEIAGWCRLDQQALSRAASPNPDHAERFLPIDAAIEVARQAGEPVIVREMARMLGWALVPMPHVDASAACGAETGGAITRLGSFLSELGQALADDGAVGDLEELARVIPAAEAGLDSLAALIVALKRRQSELLAQAEADAAAGRRAPGPAEEA